MFEQKGLARRTSRAARLSAPVMQQERELASLGANRNWPFRVLGIAPVPTTAVYHNNWWLVPVAEDHSQIPARALERVRAIYEAGIRPKAFVIVHEAPAQLPAPANLPKVSRLDVWSRQMTQHTITAIKVVGTVIATVVVPLMLATLGAGLLLSLGLVGAVLTDPCLIVVTEDDVWIQIDYWMA